MKKRKEYNLFQKLRAALRDVYRYSPMRREAIKKATIKDSDPKSFECLLCNNIWPIQMAEVDHEPALGPLVCLEGNYGSLGGWTNRLFFGPIQVICKICHKKKTAQQRKVARNG